MATEMSLDDMLEELQTMEQTSSQTNASESSPGGQIGKPSVGGGSTTTKQLDALLVELSTFKPPPPPSPSPTPSGQSDEMHYSVINKKKEEKRESRPPKPPVTTALDSMLEELGTGVQLEGVDTTQKGCCVACSKAIHGKLLNAMGRTWHPEHFVCAICEEELASKSFYEYDGKPYCEKDYNEMLAPRCAYCNGPILEVGVCLSGSTSS